MQLLVLLLMLLLLLALMYMSDADDAICIAATVDVVNPVIDGIVVVVLLKLLLNTAATENAIVLAITNVPHIVFVVVVSL